MVIALEEPPLAPIKPQQPARFPSLKEVIEGVGRGEVSPKQIKMLWHKMSPDAKTAVILHFLEGEAFWQQGNYQEALKAYENGLKLKSDQEEAWYNKGVLLGKLGRYQEALTAYEEALKLRPEDAEAWNNTGAALRSLGKHKEALNAFEKALSLRPDYADAWYNKGVALFKLGDLGEALTAFEKAHLLYDTGRDKRALYKGWSTIVLWMGVLALLDNRIRDFEDAGLKYIDILEKAEQDGLGEVVQQALVDLKGPLKKKKEREAFEELETLIDLMKIKDPFEAWEALGKVVSARWPKGLSVLKEIRQERR